MPGRKNKAQFFTEFAILIAIIAAVIIGMKVFMVRAVQEKFRQSADIFGQGEQYEKGLTQVTNLDGSTTNIGQPPPSIDDNCNSIVMRVARLEEAAKTLNVQADSLDRSGDDTEATLPELQREADRLKAEARQKEAEARDLRVRAKALIAEADKKQAQIDKYKTDFPECFSKGGSFKIGSFNTKEIDCSELITKVKKLEEEINHLHSEANDLQQRATNLENESRSLHSQADSLYDGIAKLKEQIQNIRAKADQLRLEAKDTQSEAEALRRARSECF